MSTVLAHLSDTHFDGGDRASFRARQAMDHLNSLPGHLDAIIVTGDITDHGLPSEAEEAEKVLASPTVPVYMCPGNHDGYTPYDGPLNRAFDIGGIRLLMADSVLQGRDEGLLAPETLQWLRSELSAAAGPVLIGLHHPPADLHQPFIDNIKLSNSGELAAIVTAHPQVLAVLCGHAHMAAATTFAGRPLLVAPGVTSTVLLPWEKDGGVPIDKGMPVMIAFHVIDDGGHITTHFRAFPTD